VIASRQLPRLSLHDKPERLFSLLGIVESSGVCPVVFEILEKLKQQYRFKYRQRR
jgi:hypothetical protein